MTLRELESLRRDNKVLQKACEFSAPDDPPTELWDAPDTIDDLLDELEVAIKEVEELRNG